MGVAVRAAVAAAEGERAAEPMPSPLDAGAPARPAVSIWAAEAVIGFPQSMQKREVASFSRPQKVQAVNRQPPRREKLMGREYRNGSEGGQ